MKLNILNINGEKKGEKELPKQFQEGLRLDIIKRAVFALFSKRRRTYGTKPEAGKRPSVRLSKRRRKYRGSYGHGISRVPRKIHSRSGTRFNWTAAFAPGTVGGRRAHPPKSERKFKEKINRKERKRAIRSALAAILDKTLATPRGHKFPQDYPFILADEFESLKKTKEVRQAFEKLKLNEELNRATQKKIRAGKGKMRNRKYRTKRGPLVVVGHTCPLMKSSKNLNVDVVDVRSLNTELLAPGTVPGRLTLFTENAIDILKEKKLFL